MSSVEQINALKAVLSKVQKVLKQYENKVKEQQKEIMIITEENKLLKKELQNKLKSDF